MPLFFFISGWFCYSSFVKYSLKQFFESKTKRLLIPYFIWSFIAFVFNAVLIGVENDKLRIEFIEIFIYSRSVWFLVQLYFSTLILRLLYHISYRFIKDKKCFWVYILGWILISIVLPNNILAFYKTKWLFPFMLVGYWAGCNKDRVLERIAKVGIGVKTLSFLVYGISIVGLSMRLNADGSKTDLEQYFNAEYDGTLGGFAIIIVCYVVSFLGIIVVYFVSNTIKRIVMNKNRSIIEAFGVHSLEIYVLHMFGVKLAEIGCSYIQINNIVFDYLIAPLIAVIIMSVIYIGLRLCAKNRILSFLF